MKFASMPENQGVDFDNWVRNQIGMSSEEYDQYLAHGLDVDTIVKHFLIAAIWADAPEGTNPRVTKEARDWATSFVQNFIGSYTYTVREVLGMPGYGNHPDIGSPEAAFGHDLYLTCAGHGVGFQDRKELDQGHDRLHLGEYLYNEIRQSHQEWHIEPQFYRGWMYL